jgi:hypothetical protein
LITVRAAHAGAGTQDAALAFGGEDGFILASTEEYNKERFAEYKTPTTEGQAGSIRFNKDTLKFEGHTGTEWVSLN